MGEKVASRKGQTYDSMSSGVDEILLFPGWATRRYQRAGTLDGACIHFCVGVHILMTIIMI
jgi:hypothetical protein